jgi:hypothetical protein
MLKTKKMKTSNQKLPVLLIGLLIALFSVNSIQAQRRGPQGPPPLPSDKEIAKMVTDLSKELSLDESQEAEIAILYVAHFEEVSDKMESGTPKRNEMEQLKSELETEVKTNLSDDQVTKYEAYLKSMASQNRNRGQGSR